MKTLGLLGGMSWQSSIEYERLINQEVNRRLGGTSSADLVVRSFNFAEIEALQEAGEWDEAGDLLAEAALNLERSGAQAILLCTNTMHLLSESITSRISVPFIHIADATGQAIAKRGVERVLLLGTRYTMEKDFYKARLAQNFGIDVSIPAQAQRDEIHRIIYEELVRGQILDSSREYLKQVIGEFEAQGAQGVIAGCTEIELLVSQEDLSIELFPTTTIHAATAVEFALAD